MVFLLGAQSMLNQTENEFRNVGVSVSISTHIDRKVLCKLSGKSNSKAEALDLC